MVARALPAVPEREVALPAPSAARAASTPLSDDERARKEAAYRDYLKSQGFTPLSEALPELSAPAAD